VHTGPAEGVNRPSGRTSHRVCHRPCRPILRSDDRAV